MSTKYIYYIISYILLTLLSGLCGVWSQSKNVPFDSIRTISLGEVVVTAIQPDASDTRSVIGQDAIRHIQATELSGLSQLLPGVLTRNPNLNLPAAFTIRSVSYEDPVNAIGTAILVDGIRMNNNTNMQQTTLGRSGILYNSSAFSGFDVRSLAPSSIEMVEVIRGVPSARYGDVTSGVVVVKSKAGIQPYTAGLRFTATEKLFSVGKGVSLGSKGGTLYVGADYALSAQDARKPEETFQRIGLQAAYAKDFPSAIFRMNFRGYHIQDLNEKGRDMVDGEFRKSVCNGVSVSMNGLWNLSKPWLSSLEYDAGLTAGYQKNQSNIYYSGTQQVSTYTKQSGEYAGYFLSPNYFSGLSVQGKPLTANASLIANLQHSIYNKVYNRFSLGIEVGTEGNQGEGIRFDPFNPPLEMVGIRARSYSDIPFIHHYTVFVEDNVRFHTGKIRTELQLGVRMNQLQTGSLHYSPTVEPRMNIRQVLWEQKEGHFLNSFSIRAGWGLMRKQPVLAYLYPDKAYTDVNCFTYNDTENNHRLAVLQTYVTDNTFNSKLRLPVNNKFEVGINFRMRGIAADVVWFREHLRNGYCAAQEAEPFTYRRYASLVSKGEQPELTSDGVINRGELLPYVTNTAFALYMRPENGIEQRKEGVEYTIDLGHWKRLCSSFLVSGSYIMMREKDNSFSAYHPQVETDSKPYPYVGIYETDTQLSNLRIWKLCSSRFQCITQIPRIGLITSLTLQAVWMDKQRRSMESNYDNMVYLADGNGNRVEGDWMNDIEYRKRLNPVYYMDGKGDVHPFTPDMATNGQFADLVLDAGSLTAFQEDSYKPYFLLNLRVTKKMGKHVSVAFCANNLTRANPKRYSRSTRQYSLMNPDLYYGAEVNIQF